MKNPLAPDPAVMRIPVLVVLVTLLVAPAARAQLDPDLVLYYPFDFGREMPTSSAGKLEIYRKRAMLLINFLFGVTSRLLFSFGSLHCFVAGQAIEFFKILFPYFYFGRSSK